MVSTVATSDCSGIAQSFDKELAGGLVFNEDSSETEDIILDMVTIDGQLYEKYQAADISKQKAYISLKQQELSDSLNLFGLFTEASQKYQCLNQSQNYAKKSGTSMAAPIAAGYAAGHVISLLKESGLSDREIYDLPEFAPSKIVQSLMETLPKYKCNHMDAICYIADKNSEHFKMPVYSLEVN